MSVRPVYYNEIDPFAADWLRTLIAMGALPEGDVDERSIEDVSPADLAPYAQCHFFAGIGGWAHALDLAGWPRDRPVWTGSCPCQSFSAAGKGGGFDDRRHLWPAWRRLIRECRPTVVFGEQVEAAIRHGWLDLVSTDLEAEGYAFGASVLGAHSVGAPHIRQRVFFVADANGGNQLQERTGDEQGREQPKGRGTTLHTGARAASGNGDARTVADRDPARRGAGRTGEAGDGRDAPRIEPSGLRAPRVVADADRRGRAGAGLHLPERGSLAPVPDPRGTGAASARVVGDPHHPRSQGRRIGGDGSDERAVGATGVAQSLAYAEHAERRPLHVDREDGRDGAYARREEAHGEPRTRGQVRGPWSDLLWLPCRDGKARPTQPGIFPLAHGVPNRVGTLRGAGNAIVAPLAAEFIRAYREVTK